MFTEYVSKKDKVNMFEADHKIEMKEKQFPIDCKNAYKMRKRLGKQILK